MRYRTASGNVGINNAIQIANRQFVNAAGEPCGLVPVRIILVTAPYELCL